MTNYLIRRVLQSLLVLTLSSAVVFGLLYLAPGGPMTEILQFRQQTSRFPINPDDIERLKKQFDLDLPLWQAYTRWAFGWPVLDDRPNRAGIVRGDLGLSWRVSQYEPTINVLMRPLPNTLILMITATTLSLLVAVPIGVYSAVHQYSRIDYLVTTGTFLGVSMPVFWLGSMLMLVFSFMFKEWGLPYLPPGSAVGVRDYDLPGLGAILAGSWQDRGLRLIMPTVTLSLLQMATWSRFTRSSMLEVLRQDYVRRPGPRACLSALSSRATPCATPSSPWSPSSPWPSPGCTAGRSSPRRSLTIRGWDCCSSTRSPRATGPWPWPTSWCWPC
jgi:peptide/nickel transport system permease protein